MWEERRYDRVHGSREELIAELLRLADGWEHLGNQRLRDACVTGVYGLQAGHQEVTVGHAVYLAEVADTTAVR